MTELSEIEAARRAAAARVTPLAEWVVVLPLVPESQTDSGIHLVAAEDASPARAEVLALGPSAGYCEELVVGSIVLMQKYQGLLYSIDREEVMLIPLDAIVGIVT